MKILPITGLIMLVAVSTMGQGQTIDVSHSKTISLSATQTGTTAPSLAKQQQPLLSPVMTRAIAHRDTDGKLLVTCHVETSPAMHGARIPVRNTTHKKVD